MQAASIPDYARLIVKVDSTVFLLLASRPSSQITVWLRSLTELAIDNSHSFKTYSYGDGGGVGIQECTS